jgi:hypothetical protein
MAELINADVLLACILRKKENISFKELRKLRNSLEEDNSNLIVDISGPSIQLALYYYPQLFEEKNDGINKVKGSELFFNSDYIDNVFISDLSAVAKKTLEDVINE